MAQPKLNRLPNQRLVTRADHVKHVVIPHTPSNAHAVSPMFDNYCNEKCIGIVYGCMTPTTAGKLQQREQTNSTNACSCLCACEPAGAIQADLDGKKQLHKGLERSCPEVLLRSPGQRILSRSASKPANDETLPILQGCTTTHSAQRVATCDYSFSFINSVPLCPRSIHIATATEAQCFLKFEDSTSGLHN